jgi:SAM-dependent methyltransferase
MLETLETAQYFDRHAARYDELIGTVSFQVDDAYDYLARYVAGAWADKNPLRIHGQFPDAIPDAEYECVVSAIALSFYNIDYAALFRKVHRVLKPGGLFVYAVNVAQNASSIDRILSGMLRKRIDITEEQLHWLKSIQQNVKLYHVPADWHRAALEQGGFTDVDCIYLRHKLGIFSGAKALVAV